MTTDDKFYYDPSWIVTIQVKAAKLCSPQVTIQMKPQSFFLLALFTVFFKVDLICESVDKSPNVLTFKRKQLISTFLRYCLLCFTRWFYLLSL